MLTKCLLLQLLSCKQVKIITILLLRWWDIIDSFLFSKQFAILYYLYDAKNFRSIKICKTCRFLFCI